MSILVFILSITISFNPSTQVEDRWQDSPGLYAIFETSMGRIVCRLFEDKTHEIVSNFVGLATGKKAFKESKTGRWVKRPFYDGLKFFRTIPDFMVQSGCPKGDGTGGPGYKISVKFHPLLKHDRPGRLSMANSGPNTNGSQFLITDRPAPWLDKYNPIFGQVVEGQEVVRKISNVQTDGRNRPLKDVVINKVIIRRIKIHEKKPGPFNFQD